MSSQRLAKASSEHRFIQLLNHGQLDPEQFATWLTQDYLFVGSLVRFAARILSHAPKDEYSFLIDALTTLKEELQWFEKKLKERGKQPNQIQALPTNVHYQKYLTDLFSHQNYFLLLTAYFAIESCYYEAWKSVSNKDYEEFKNRWGSAQFGEFIQRLRNAVDRASSKASEKEKGEAHVIWNTIMDYESTFWNMALNHSSNKT